VKPDKDLANQDPSSPQTDQVAKPPEAPPQCAMAPWMYHPGEHREPVSETHYAAMAVAYSAAPESADVVE